MDHAPVPMPLCMNCGICDGMQAAATSNCGAAVSASVSVSVAVSVVYFHGLLVAPSCAALHPEAGMGGTDMR
jgi:hypothetical protein